MHSARAGMRQAVRDTTAVADDIQAGILGLQVLVQFHLHIVELDLHTVEQRIVVRSARGYFVQCIDHLNDPVQDPFRHHQAQVAWRCRQCGCHKGFCNPGRSTPAPADQVAEPLYEKFMACLREFDVHVESGVFGAEMQVESVNDGPVTIILDSAEL